MLQLNTFILLEQFGVFDVLLSCVSGNFDIKMMSEAAKKTTMLEEGMKIVRLD